MNFLVMANWPNSLLSGVSAKTLVLTFLYLEFLLLRGGDFQDLELFFVTWPFFVLTHWRRLSVVGSQRTYISSGIY